MSTVLITGSSKGLGAALAEHFSKYDCNIILHGRNYDDIVNIKNIVEENGSIAHVIIGDLQDESIISELSECAIENNIDVLINNAGLYLNKTFSEMSMSEFKKIINVNLIATVSITHKIFDWFKKNKMGTIINVNSLAGKQGSDGELAYCASKFGLRGFSESLQFDATRHGIRVVDVYLGAMKTGMTGERIDQELFIEPSDAARVIFNASKGAPTLRINEISLNRIRY